MNKQRIDYDKRIGLPDGISLDGGRVRRKALPSSVASGGVSFCECKFPSVSKCLFTGRDFCMSCVSYLSFSKRVK